MRKDEIPNFRKMLGDELRSLDEGAKSEFNNHFSKQIDEFTVHMAITLRRWHELLEAIPDGDERQGLVAAILFTNINMNVQSFKLFITGYTVAAGALFRQVLEGMALSFLCSAKELPVLNDFMNDRYSTNCAIQHLNKNYKAANVRHDALKTLNIAYQFLHKFSHPTKLTIATGANFSKEAAPNIGAFFDPAKKNEYEKDINGRVSFAAALPDAIDGVAYNLKSW